MRRRWAEPSTPPSLSSLSFQNLATSGSNVSVSSKHLFLMALTEEKEKVLMYFSDSHSAPGGHQSKCPQCVIFLFIDGKKFAAFDWNFQFPF